MTDTDATTTAMAAADNETNAAIISSLAERLSFFFSNANLRQDKWMRNQLSSSHDGNSMPLDTLLKFNTLKSISTDKSLLALAAVHESVRTLIAYDPDKDEIRRVVPFDYKTMGDGSTLSLWVKNVPVTEPPPTTTPTVMPADEKDAKDNDDEVKDEEAKEDADGDEAKAVVASDADAEAEPFRPRYAVTRDEIKSLFEPYGRVAIIQLRYGRKSDPKSSIVGNEDYEKYTSPNQRGLKRGESFPLGVAIVEFESVEGMENACRDLLIHDDDDDDDDDDAIKQEEKEMGDDADKAATGTKVLELKGNKLIIERMRPHKMFKNNSKKRSRDDDDDGDDDNDDEDGAGDDDEAFEPITLDWIKGCVIALTGLSTTACDRESIRDAVSDILGVTKDVKTSGLYVDYTRGQSTGNIRLNEPKPDEMNELVTKLMDGSVLIANEKVESAKILEGEEEEQYMKDYVAFLNKMKKMKEDEKRSQKKMKRGGGRGGGRGRGGRGRGGRGRGRGKR